MTAVRATRNEQAIAGAAGRPLRVCLISFSGYPDQGATYFYEMARSLARLGIDVTAIAVRKNDEPREAVEDGVRVIREALPLTVHWGSPRRWAGKLLFLARAARYVRESRFDVTHVYCTMGSFLLPALAGRRTRWVHEYQTGAVSARTRAARWLENRVRGLQGRFFDANLVITDRLGERLFGRRRRFDVVPAGVNVRAFRRDLPRDLRVDLGIPGDAIVFVHAGVLEAQRATEVPLLAFARVARSRRDLWLLMPGKGSQLDDLRRIAIEAGVADRVWLPGYVPYPDVPRVFAAADAGLSYLPPVDYYEGQPPMKVMEYLGAGLPVIASDVSSHRTLLEHGRNALLPAPGVESFAEALAAFAADAALRARLASAARESVDHLTYDRVAVDRVVPIYRRLVSAP